MTSTNTPRRTIRVPDELWYAALTAAQERGETLSDVIRDRLANYLKENTP